MRFSYYAVSSLIAKAPRMAPRGRAPRRTLAALLAAAALAGAAAGCSSASGSSSSASASADTNAKALDANPEIDPGTSLGATPAPDFTLTDQFGRQVSLSSFHGKAVIIAFTDSECTTVCPLTTQSMLIAKDLLGKASDQVQLVGIDANPDATAVSDVMGYSRSHGMVNQWEFLTGTVPQLKSVWKSYNIAVQIEQGDIDHTPAVYVIDPQGREQKLYLTQMNYASITQAGQVMAQELSSLLPGHPPLVRTQSLAYIAGVGPTKAATLPGLPSGSLTLGPGKPRLTVFFATWLDETSDLRSELTGLNQYAQTSAADGLPSLVAVDETSSEPSVGAASTYLSPFRGSLRYPVALDSTGTLADGYGVQDQPWYVLTSATGKVLWTHDGWLSISDLTAAVRKAAS